MKATADNVKLILDQFFANIQLSLNGHNIPTDLNKRGGYVTVNKANKGLIILSISDNAQFVEELPETNIWPAPLVEAASYIETLKHYPGNRETPPETVETYTQGYTSAENAARDLIGFWVEYFVDWALEGIRSDVEAEG